MKKRDNWKKKNKDFVRSNGQIRIREVRVVHDGTNLGVMPTIMAQQKAHEAGLDLVEVAPAARPPVCSIVDYGKYMYERQKKKKDTKQSSQKEKEISFRYVIDDNDLNTHANKCRKFFDKGFRVKLVVKFKAREKAHKEQGFTVINKLIEMLEDVATVDKTPGFEGHNITARLEKQDLGKSLKKDKDERSKPDS